jgi:hypothetical protein
MAGKPFDILMGLIGMTRKDTGEQRADSLGSTADRMAECDQNRVRPEAEFTIDPADFMKVRTILKGTGPYPKHELSLWRNLRRRFRGDYCR